MDKVTRLWKYRAVQEGFEALTLFEETGSREGFKAWSEKYHKQIEEAENARLHSQKHPR